MTLLHTRLPLGLPLVALVLVPLVCGGLAGGAGIEASFGVAPLTTVDWASPPAHFAAPPLYEASIVAGSPDAWPADEPHFHVDSNLSGSPHAGVGSVFAQVSPGFGYLGTGAMISPRHVLTAGHVVETDADGSVDFAPEDVLFFLNDGGSGTSVIGASAIHLHPDFTGFNNPAVNDDLAILELAEPVPESVPIYPLYRSPLSDVQITRQVGYGQTGAGTDGFSGQLFLDVKRYGHNTIDQVALDDEGLPVAEVWYADFDDPDGTYNVFGDGSLGNLVETTLGGGDSGGPSFVSVDGELQIVGTNTFSVSWVGYPEAPLFGSGLGGMLLYPYLDWIDNVVPEPSVLAMLAIGAVLLRRRRAA